jgi:hypothetical protein
MLKRPKHSTIEAVAPKKQQQRDPTAYRSPVAQYLPVSELTLYSYIPTYKSRKLKS